MLSSRLPGPNPSISTLPIHHIDQFLAFLPQLQVRLQYLKRPIPVLRAQAADVRRHDAVGRIPQRMVLGERFRIGHVQGGAPQAAILAIVSRTLLERRDQIVLLQNLPARNVADEGVALAEDGELRCGQEVLRVGRDGHADQKVIDVLGEEVVQRSLVEAGKPGGRNAPVRVTRPRHDESLVFLRLWRGPWVGRIRDDIHSHCFGDPGDLPADAPVAEDTEPSPDSIADSVERGIVGVMAPVVFGLKSMKNIIFARVDEGREEYPENLANNFQEKRHVIHHSAMVGP